MSDFGAMFYNIPIEEMIYYYMYIIVECCDKYISIDTENTLDYGYILSLRRSIWYTGMRGQNTPPKPG